MMDEPRLQQEAISKSDICVRRDENGVRTICMECDPAMCDREDAKFYIDRVWGPEFDASEGIEA